jgi:two-component system, NtrC family, sensor kinase
LLKGLSNSLRSGQRSLKTTLALYFLPISILPTVLISFYAIEIFEDSLKESIVRRAGPERDAIVAEIDATETDLLQQARAHAKSPRLFAAVRAKSSSEIQEAISSIRSGIEIKVFSVDGNYLGGRKGNSLAYISKESLKRVRSVGETVDRYFSPDNKGFLTVVRVTLTSRNSPVGILEEELNYGSRQLADLKTRRGVDAVILNRDFTSVGASFALSADVLRKFSAFAFQPTYLNAKDPIFVQFGDTRYTAFLYDLPAQFNRNRHWGYLALFFSMNGVDATVGKLKMALVYLSILLVLVAVLAIFIFSNRLVRPIEVLVSAMKRVKTGRVEQIPALDSTYEIEYLVRSFNDMSRNVSAAKRALEIKLEELRYANQEIKETQSHLVQSAKMISLGQLVAGVAHELNNPIAFIYSNMHHLSEYVRNIREVVEAYRKLKPNLSAIDSAKVTELETRLELDFILKDIEDLTRSCVDGAQRIKDIVLGLRTFSRIEESTFRLADLHEGLRSTVKLLATEFKDRVQIHEELGHLPLVECNLSQMNQVFMNLLSNGGQAIHGKGNMWIRTRLENNTAVIEIQDDGIGIARELQEKIFDPFFTTKKVGEGTGLGLSIAYGLIQKHHGTITVNSELGKGTLFTIRIPLRQPAENYSALA